MKYAHKTIMEKGEIHRWMHLHEILFYQQFRWKQAYYQIDVKHFHRIAESQREKKYVWIKTRIRWQRICTWDSFVAPVITDETLGFDAHQAIASWAKGTPSSSAMGFSPLTFLRVSSTRDLLARFCKKIFSKKYKDLSFLN